MDMRPLRFASAALAFCCVGLAQESRAQSTDGYHAIQVFPIVADTATYAQRFHFRAVYPWETTEVSVMYYPADGTAQVGPVTCQTFEMTNAGERRFSSLRDLCPSLSPGSAFGTLVARNSSGQPFAAASRVNSAAGIGFAIEAFPASDFTTAKTAVTGLRRLAAQGGSPAFQSNCFVGRLAEFAPVGAPATNKVTLRVSDASGALLGMTELEVNPGQLIRLLDVFAAVGNPSGNIDDAVATFETAEETGAGLISFCTVQDNTHFGADFRIAKQELSWYGRILAAQDETAMRWSWSTNEDPIDAQVIGATFAIPAGASRNVHVMYFRHPDNVGCALNDLEGRSLGAAYGLEMRMRVLDSDGWRVLAGGNDSTAFFDVYLGDKPRHGGGANTSYQIEVESNGLDDGAPRPYQIACLSGSGHTRAILVRKGLATTF